MNNNYSCCQAALTGSSFKIYTWLSGQVLIGSVTVQVPDTWTSIECGVDLTESYNVGVGSQYYIKYNISNVLKKFYSPSALINSNQQK